VSSDSSNLDSPPVDRQSGGSGDGRGDSPHTASDPYRAVFENAPDGILLVGEDGRIREANREAARLFGYDPEELVGMEVEQLVPPEVRTRHRADRERYVQDPHSRPMGIGLELAGVRKDGSRVPVEISLSPLRGGGPVLVIAVIRDLTDRRRLRYLGADAVRATEEERRRIARELHDDTAQRLAALILRVRLAERASDPEAAAADLAEVREELHAVSDGIRRIARGLRPPELEDVGLEAALRAHVRERCPPELVQLDLGSAGESLALDTALAAYRIAQEALSNALRHGRAEQIELRTRRDGDRFVLEVRDDGRGFDPEDLRDPDAGLGLLGMKERAAAVRAHLEVVSAAGKGTRIRFEVRLPQGAPVPSGVSNADA